MKKITFTIFFLLCFTSVFYGQRRDLDDPPERTQTASVNPTERMERLQAEGRAREAYAEETAALARERALRDQAREAAQTAQRRNPSDAQAERDIQYAAKKEREARQAIEKREAATREYERAVRERDREREKDGERTPRGRRDID